MKINTNISAFNTSRQIKITSYNWGKTTEKLSSGYCINRAADDAAGLAISEKMRRQVRGLNRAAENIQDGVSLCNVADGALNEIHDILQRQRQLLIQAGNDTNSREDKEYIEQEIKELGAEFDRIFEDTEFNERKIFKGKDTILSGPTVRSDQDNTQYEKNAEDYLGRKMIWVDPANPPADHKDLVGTDHLTSLEVLHYQYEVPGCPDEKGHVPYTETDDVQTVHTVVDKEIYERYEYTKIDDAKFLEDVTSLKKPKDCISANGYVSNLTNVAGNLSLSCAMSQMGIKVDGKLVDVSIYGKCIGTTYSENGNSSISQYKIGDNLTLNQRVDLVDSDSDGKGDTYSMIFDVINKDSQDHKVEFRYAFDVMNTPGKCINNGSSSFDLESDYAVITVGAAGPGIYKAMLGSIDDMYGADNWDAANVVDGANAGSHLGACFWAGGTVRAGMINEVAAIKYGPIQIKEPYYVDTYREEKSQYDVTTDHVYTETEIMPEYLDIQAGTENDPGMRIPIRLWNLSADKMGVVAGTDISAFSVKTSLHNIDQAFTKINSIRSYYGATTNRLEHAYKVNKNSEENTQAAESLIRDTDMAKTMVEYSNQSIIQQAASSMLAQANQENQGVLSLLG